jgi:hypothetical protein
MCCKATNNITIFLKLIQNFHMLVFVQIGSLSFVNKIVSFYLLRAGYRKFLTILKKQIQYFAHKN